MVARTRELSKPGNVWQGWNLCKEAPWYGHGGIKTQVATPACWRCQDYGASSRGKLHAWSVAGPRAGLCVCVADGRAGGKGFR